MREFEDRLFGFGNDGDRLASNKIEISIPIFLPCNRILNKRKRKEDSPGSSAPGGVARKRTLALRTL